PSDMALVERRADDGIAARAGRVLTAIARSAEVAVVARRAVGGVRVGALAGGGVARAGVVALVERRADDGIAARAGPVLTAIARSAEVAVVARRAVGLHRV